MIEELFKDATISIKKYDSDEWHELGDLSNNISIDFYNKSEKTMGFEKDLKCSFEIKNSSEVKRMIDKIFLKYRESILFKHYRKVGFNRRETRKIIRNIRSHSEWIMERCND